MAFQLLAARRAAPALVAKFVREVAVQERNQQGVSAIVLRVDADPHAADVYRQLAPAAREKFAAHHGGDPVRFEKAPDEMRFGRVPGGMELLHAAMVVRARAAEKAAPDESC